MTNVRSDVGRLEVLRAATPIAAAAGGSVLLTLIAAGLIGRFSTTSLAGVALGGVIYVVLSAPMTGVFAAHQIRIARLHGAGLQAQAGALTWRVVRWGSLVLGIIATLIITIALILMPMSHGITHEASRYLLGRAVGLPAAFVGSIAANHLYVVGKRKSPLMLLAVNAAVMLPLGATLIYGFGLGALGDGIAGAAAVVVGALIVLWHFRRALRGVDETTADGEATYRERFGESHEDSFWSFAAPLMLSNLLDQFGTLVLTVIVGVASVSAEAALRVGINLQTVIFIAVNAVSVAIVTQFASQLGIVEARGSAAARTLARAHSDGATAAALLVCLIGGGFAAFGTDDGAVRTAVLVVVVVSLCCIPACSFALYYVSRLRIEGRTGADARSNIAAVWLVLVPIAFTLSRLAGPLSVFAAYFAYWIARALLARRAFKRVLRETRPAELEVSANNQDLEEVGIADA